MVAEIYKVNNVSFQPTNSRWLPRSPLAIQGDGRPIYSAVRAFEIKWEFTTYAEWANAQAVYDAVQSTGSSIVQIPKFTNAAGEAYGFSVYSGVHIAEPVIEKFFEGFPSSMVLIITNIVVA